MAFTDSEGTPLTGGTNYRLNLPTSAPGAHQRAGIDLACEGLSIPRPPLTPLSFIRYPLKSDNPLNSRRDFLC